MTALKRRVSADERQHRTPRASFPERKPFVPPNPKRHPTRSQATLQIDDHIVRLDTGGLGNPIYNPAEARPPRIPAVTIIYNNPLDGKSFLRQASIAGVGYEMYVVPMGG